MRRWRVGTLSLGLLMIALGIIILVAQINQYRVLDTMLTWWPVVLILIGGEVLLQVYTSKEQDARVKYDVFSIFIILILVFFSIGMYALSSTGVIELAARAVSGRDINMEIPRSSCEVDNGIEEIIIRAPGESMSIETSSGQNVAVFGTVWVNAVDRKEAQDIVNQGKLVAQREGNKLYVSIIPIPRSGDMKPGAYDAQYTILLPEGRKVRIESTGYYDIKVAPEAVESIWLVNGRGRINLKVRRESDLLIEARVRDESHLAGNAGWSVGKEEPENPREESGIRGILQWGEGRNKITILDADVVQVDEI